MSKHKRFHGMRGKGAERKAYAFFHKHHPYGSVLGQAQIKVLKSAGAGGFEKTPASAANTGEGKQTPQSN